MKTYSVLVVGMGKRGLHHAAAFNANPRFHVIGLCDIDLARCQTAAPKLGQPQVGTDARALAATLKPDVFCFCTLPSLRLDMIRAGIECGARLIPFEKPIALTSAEALQIKQLLDQSQSKAVVSHQHRYGAHYQKVKDIVASGALGRVHTVYATATGWMAHMLSHLLDYTCWFNDYIPAEWAMAQAAGRGKLTDMHPSPDYLAGFVQFKNGVRGIYECGAGAPDVPEVDYWWRKCRIGAQGSDGFAEVFTGGGWRALTRKDGFQTGQGTMNYDADMPPYVQQMADWLDDPARVHPCCFDHAWIGFEAMAGLQISAAQGGQVALPLTAGVDELSLLKARLADRQVLVSFDGNKKEYGVI
jgi:predicted dehydrogenase